MKYKKYEKMKDSGIEWIGEIPSEWNVEDIKYHAYINKGTLPESTDPSLSITYIDIGNVNSTGDIELYQELQFADAPSRARRIVRTNDIIVSTVRTYLKAIAFIKDGIDNLIASTGYAVLTPHGITPRYFFYWMRSTSIIDNIVASSVGVSYPAINASDIGNIPLFIPPLPKQHAIAAFLDRLIEKKERLIELLSEKRQALITRAVTKGIPHPPIPSLP